MMIPVYLYDDMLDLAIFRNINITDDVVEVVLENAGDSHLYDEFVYLFLSL